MKTIDFSYSYKHSDETSLEPLLSALEGDIGGVRTPYERQWGAIDIVAIFAVTISFVAGATVDVVVKKYLEGLLDGDAIKGLGRSHREQIQSWFSGVRRDTNNAVQAFEPLRDLHREISHMRNEYATELIVPLGNRTLYAVLNHVACSPEILRNLPDGIVKALELAAQGQLPPDSSLLQLYFDKDSKQWKYLFAPIMETYGRWIDRFVDLDTGEPHLVNSRKQFLEIFRPESKDEFKFLLSPFREQ